MSENNIKTTKRKLEETTLEETTLRETKLEEAKLEETKLDQITERAESDNDKIAISYKRGKPTIVVGNIQPWQGWCAIDKCKICGAGFFSLTFEFTYWRDGVKIYISEGCLECTRELIQQDKEYSSIAFWRSHRQGYSDFRMLGLIDEQNLDDKVESSNKN